MRDGLEPARSRAGMVAYALLFVVVLPLLLLGWAHRLDALLDLPRVGTIRGGVLLALAGGVLMAFSVVALRVRGGGWPMSPFPPARRVTDGPYGWMEDPIYAGAILLVAGAAVALGSPAGIWVVTPVFAAACAVFVAGYEHEATAGRFGASQRAPLLHLAPAADSAPAVSDRLSVYLLVFLPWFVAYEGVNLLGVPRDALRLGTRWDAAIPVMAWTEAAYFFAYPMLLAFPLLARTQRELRRFALESWVAIVSVTGVYLVLPSFVAAKPVPDDAFLAPLLLWERAFDDHSTAFPAFHVVWSCIAAAAYSRLFPRLRALWWLTAGAIAAACVTTGMHVIADVLAGAVFAALVLRAGRIWAAVLRLSEWVAGSWREWDFGAVRLMSHGIYAGMGAFAGIVLVGAFAGESQLPAACFVAAATIAGAGLWAQFIEGSPLLLRPYGFYGGLIGATLAIASAPLMGADGWLLFGAYAIAAPVVQAFGRIRCLIQGCCHGRICEESLGIRFGHPRSRVTRLAGLAGKPLHPTQVYSIVWSLASFVLLVRLWMVAAPLSFVAGAFFVLNGLGRFVEEHFRGEPQTPMLAGLRVYQWLAVASVIAGAAITTIRTPSAPSPSPVAPAVWMAAALVGVVTYAAYGVDFPRLNTRFARLV